MYAWYTITNLSFRFSELGILWNTERPICLDHHRRGPQSTFLVG